MFVQVCLLREVLTVQEDDEVEMLEVGGSPAPVQTDLSKEAGLTCGAASLQYYGDPGVCLTDQELGQNYLAASLSSERPVRNTGGDWREPG